MYQQYTKTLLILALIFLLAAPAIAAVTPGRITVYSTPSGANVCIDNDDCDITPATFSVEGNAWHMIVVTEKGYRDWTETVYVTSAMTSTASAFLDQDPDATGILVSVTPGSGKICLDNNVCRDNVGLISGNGSTLFTGVSAGYHTISVESPAGYEDTMKLVEVKLGKITSIGITLDTVVTTPPTSRTPIPATGMVRVYVDMTGSTICIDNARCQYNVGGDSTSGTGTMVFDYVTANELHTITVAADGYEPFSTSVAVERDLIASVDVKLRPKGGVAPVKTTTAIPVSTATTPVITATPPPTMPTARSDPGAAPVLGVLVLFGAVALFRNNRK
jgi:hypothetical protein